jgi:polar amino acid transport system substrate-binding protein
MTHHAGGGALSRRKAWRGAAVAVIMVTSYGLAACSSTGRTSVSSTTSTAPLSKVSFDQRLHDALPDRIKSGGKLTIVGPPHPPDIIVGSDGQSITGEQADFVPVLEKMWGIKIQQVLASSLATTLTGLQSGRYDMAFVPVKDSRARQATFDLVDWLISADAIMYVKVQRTVGKSTDLCGTRIAAIQSGSTLPDLARLATMCEGLGKSAPVVSTFNDENTEILAMNAGRVDAAAMGLAPALYILTQQVGKNLGLYKAVDLTPLIYTGSVFQKNDPLATVFLDTLKKLAADGVLQEITAKYGQDKALMAEPAINAGTNAT